MRRSAERARFNLSAWALAHQQLVVFFMLLVMTTGVLSYIDLPRNEDPAFTIKTAVVSAQWPGATVEDTMQLVTDTLEKKLQETPFLDFIESETRAGKAVIFVNLRDDTPPDQVPTIWYQIRKKCRISPHRFHKAFRVPLLMTNLATPMARFMALRPMALVRENCGIKSMRSVEA